jgi:hypothetical protein
MNNDFPANGEKYFNNIPLNGSPDLFMLFMGESGEIILTSGANFCEYEIHMDRATIQSPY